MSGRPDEQVTIRNVTYDSHRAASEALGVKISTISRAKRRGTLDGVGLGIAGIVPKSRDPNDDIAVLMKRGRYTEAEALAIVNRPKTRIRAVPMEFMA